MGVVAVQTFFKRSIILPDKGVVLVLIAVGKAFKLSQKLFNRSALDIGKNAILLEYLPAYVKRQVFAIDNTAHKAKVHGKQFLVVVGNKYALYKELYPALIVGIKHIKGSLCRHVKEGGIFLSSFGFGMNIQERIFRIMRKRFIKTLVILF